jgi:hypothetical protein
MVSYLFAQNASMVVILITIRIGLKITEFVQLDVDVYAAKISWKIC